MADTLDPNEPIMAERGRSGRKSREAEQRPAAKWAPPALLPDPTPEEGYVFRWVRVSAMGQDDSMNVSSKLREGWEPVKAADHPEVHIMGATDGRFKDCIIVGGLMLCKVPKEIVDQRDAYYRDMAKSQMVSVDNNFMRQNDARMPLFNERRSEVSFGKGKS
jgi:hypothetical protein